MSRKSSEKSDVFSLPLLPLTDSVVYPSRVITIHVSGAENLALLQSYDGIDETIAVGFCEPGTKDDIRPVYISNVAVTARIIDRIKMPGEGFRVTLQGLKRVELLEVDTERPFFNARFTDIEERTRDPFRVNVYVQKAINLYERLAGLNPNFTKEFTQLLKVNVDNPGRFADLLCATVDFEYAERHRIIQAVSVDQRLQRVLELLRGALDRVKVAQEVEKRAKGDIEESRREYYLRQQMKTIQKELGDEDLSRRDADDYEGKLEALELSEDIKSEAAREIDRLRHIQPSSSEYQVIKTYLDRFFSLPWGQYSDEKIDLASVRKMLDEGHFGLEQVKERILEFLAVRKLNPGHKGPILCFVGPPGVGKTSLGKSIAESIGRDFFRISVGGVRDEAEIRGHRRTYVGAMPGKILNGLARAGAMNPLLMLDEIDKIGSDQRGDPAAALLEVLDPEQNGTFTDHYFNIPFDLSKVLFIVTANYLHDIPKPLLDRLEVINIEGYTETEKFEISNRHLIPRVVEQHGLQKHTPKFSEPAIRDVIRYWTREAGVRNLRRCFEKICRKVARKQVESEAAKKRVRAIKIAPKEVQKFLGPKRYYHDDAIERDEVGVANGLAWTSAGGELLVIEALKIKGSGKLVITGKLGDVMKESVQAAFSFVRSRRVELGIEDGTISTHDVHIHFPAGAVPKDGPSAGVTVTLALASLLAGLKVRSDFAMTGEVTLRGKVLAVGGIKDKLLAAYRAGIKNIVLPKQNEKDLVDVPDEVKKKTKFHLLEHVDTLLDLALIGYDPKTDDNEPLPVPDHLDDVVVDASN
ncbi:MAG: endopeptidase La [Myxococcales bacterium]|nr:endopeptidase La [Myxococcales bacterium]